MRGVRNDVLRQECLRLRTEERLSLKEIRKITGVSLGSLSPWLVGYPLSSEERKKKARDGCRGGRKPKDRGEESLLHKMASSRDLTRLQKGAIAEAAVLLRLVASGRSAFVSPFDGDRIDFVVSLPGSDRMLKLQVKLADRTGGHLPSVNLRCRAGSHGIRRYSPKEFDFIAGYDLYTDICYVWSSEDVSRHRRRVCASKEFSERWDKLRQAIDGSLPSGGDAPTGASGDASA